MTARIASRILLAAAVALLLAGGDVGTTPARAQAGPPGFSIIFASDPQLTWWRQGEGGACVGIPADEVADCVDEHGRSSNEALVQGMNDVVSLGTWPQTGVTKGAGSPVTTPSAVILNGDLTSYYHKAEKEPYDEIYADLDYRLYPGLGNHDYQNNRDDCVFDNIYYPDQNRCAKEAVWWMTRTIGSLPGVVRHDAPSFVAVENAGAYDIRFTVSWKRNGIDASTSTGAYQAGQWRSVRLPAGATNVRVRIEGWVFFPVSTVPFFDVGWRELSDETLATPVAACYESRGAATIGDHSAGSQGCGGTAFPDASSGSLAYSFDIGGYHFVQLQNWPGYADEMPAVTTIEEVLTFGLRGSPGFNVTPSYDWLRNDLVQATAAGKPIVLNMHDAEWLIQSSAAQTPDQAAFAAAIRDQNVVGIFSGHIHESAGQRLTLDNGSRTIPVWQSGSAECGTFLYADFRERWYNVAVVRKDFETSALEFLRPGWTCDTFGRYADNKARQGSIRTVEINRPPRILLATAELPPFAEGRPVHFTSSFTDPDDDQFRLRWEFGDGTTELGTTPVHTYAQDGTYTVRVTADDGFGGVDVRTFPITIANVDPTLMPHLAPPADEGALVQLTGSVSDPGADPLRLTIDWGDGRLDQLTLPAGSTTYSVSHRFRDDDPSGTAADEMPVRMMLEDLSGGSAQAATTVTVRNVAPTLTAEPAAVVENGEATLSGTIVDPGDRDTFVLRVEWADGAVDRVPLAAGSTRYDVSHRYLDDDPPGTSEDVYAVRLSLADDDGGSATAAAPVRVANAPPRASIDEVADELGTPLGPANPVVLVDQPVRVTASATDVGARDVFASSIAWDDGTPGTDLGGLTEPASAKHSFAAPRVYEVVLAVVDDDTGRDEVSQRIEVVDAGGAVERTVALLRGLAPAPNAVAARRIDAAIADAIGTNRGTANNGALDQLRRGNLQAALVKLQQLVDDVDAAAAADPRLELGSLLRLVGLTAKSIAATAVDRASARAARPGERRMVEQARALAQTAGARLAAGDVMGAVRLFRNAVQEVQSLLERS